MIHEPLANGLRTKCVYVWMGLRTCAAPSVNGLHTIRRKLKFVVFLREHKENWMCWVSFPRAGCPFHAPGVLCSPQVREKLINQAPNMRRTQTAPCISGTLVYIRFKVCSLHSLVRKIVPPFYSWLDKLTSYSAHYEAGIKIRYHKIVALIYHKR